MMRVAVSRRPIAMRDFLLTTAGAVLPGPNGSLTHRLAQGSVVALAIYLAGAGFTYCTQLAIARIIGPEGYGIFAYVVAWMTVLAYFATLGFDVSLLRFLPAYNAQQAPGLMRGVILFAQRIALAMGLGVAFLGSVTVLLSGDHSRVRLTNTFLIGFALVPLWASLWVRCSIARAFGGIVSALAPDRVVRDGLLLCVLAAACLGMGWRPNACSTMGVAVMCSLMAFALASAAAVKLQPQVLNGIVPIYAARLWLRSATPLVMIATIEPFVNRAGVFLLGWAGEVKAAGIYAVAFNIAFLSVLPRTAVNALFAPVAADLFARNDMKGLQALIARTGLWTLLSAVSIALPLSLVARELLMLFGHDFSSGATALRILLVGQVIAAGTGSQRPLMMMTGHELSAALLLGISAAVGGVAAIALIGPFGLTGAAIATTLSLLVWNLAMAVFIWRQLGLVPSMVGIFRL
jgi:O-antigen/teichoic acid export membrane protein